GAPALALVEAHPRALVGGDDHPFRVVGRDPQLVRVPEVVVRLHFLEVLPAVGAAIENAVGEVDGVDVYRVGGNPGEIEGPPVDAAAVERPVVGVVDASPVGARVVGPEQPAA